MQTGIPFFIWRGARRKKIHFIPYLRTLAGHLFARGVRTGHLAAPLCLGRSGHPSGHGAHEIWPCAVAGLPLESPQLPPGVQTGRASSRLKLIENIAKLK